jgi:hypothetical protein
MLCGFAVGFVIQFRLYKFVSKERVHAVEDVTALWKNSVPPKEVLNDEGLKLYKYFQAGIIIFVGGCFIQVFGGIFGGIWRFLAG